MIISDWDLNRGKIKYGVIPNQVLARKEYAIVSDYDLRGKIHKIFSDPDYIKKIKKSGIFIENKNTYSLFFYFFRYSIFFENICILEQNFSGNNAGPFQVRNWREEYTKYF